MPEPARDLDEAGKPVKSKANNPELGKDALFQLEARLAAVRNEHPDRSSISTRVGYDSIHGELIAVYRCNVCGLVLTPQPDGKTWKHELKTPKAR